MVRCVGFWWRSCNLGCNHAEPEPEQDLHDYIINNYVIVQVLLRLSMIPEAPAGMEPQT